MRHVIHISKDYLTHDYPDYPGLIRSAKSEVEKKIRNGFKFQASRPRGKQFLSCI